MLRAIKSASSQILRLKICVYQAHKMGAVTPALDKVGAKKPVLSTYLSNAMLSPQVFPEHKAELSIH